MKTIRNRFKSTALAIATALIFGATQLHAQAPSDPQIVGIVVSANQIDIDAAKLALKKSKNKQVRELAQQMVDDHTSVLKSVGELGKKLNATPAASDTQKSLKDQATATNKKLSALKGAAFDKAYADNEVAYHQQVIDAVSKVLIPNAQNAELKSALTGAAPLFQGHLDHAKQVQSSLRSGETASASKSESHKDMSHKHTK